MTSPLRIAEFARQSVEEAEQAFNKRARQSLYSKLHNLVGFAIKGGYSYDVSQKEDGWRWHRRSGEEILTELFKKLAEDFQQPCQKLYEEARHRFVECYNLSAPEFQALEQEIDRLKARLRLRNRQIRDLRRQARK